MDLVSELLVGLHNLDMRGRMNSFVRATKMRSYCLRITVAQLIALVLTSLCVSGLKGNQQNLSAAELLEQFKSTKVFWQQFDVAKKIVALHDTSVLQELAGWLNHEDRHLRGNAAFIFAGLGDDRGFEVIRTILTDRSERPQGFIAAGNWTLRAQIREDRYYAAHLFGDLKDPRAVPILAPLLRDEEVNYIVPWALGEIGDKRAVGPLIEALDDKNPSIRVLAIYALEKLGAKEALPRLHALLDDQQKTNFGEQVSVANAAKAAIAKLQAKP
jgi:HEAT repeat protein